MVVQGKLKSGRLSRLIGSECHLGILLPRATNVRAAPTLAYELSNRRAARNYCPSDVFRFQV